MSSRGRSDQNLSKQDMPGIIKMKVHWLDRNYPVMRGFCVGFSLNYHKC